MSIKKEDDIYYVLDNYFLGCTDKEWEELLDKYCVHDEENYMGEVRDKLGEAIINEYENLSELERSKKRDFFSKYLGKDKETQQEYEIEK